MNNFFWWLGLPIRAIGGLIAGLFIAPFVMIMPQYANTGYGNIKSFVLGE